MVLIIPLFFVDFNLDFLFKQTGKSLLLDGKLAVVLLQHNNITLQHALQLIHKTKKI
jgi:hypothetical protein